MKRIGYLAASLLFIALAAMPAQAFTAKSLTITIAHNGDAEMNMQYELSLFEQSAVFFRIADPAGELKKAFDANSDEPVTVEQATSSSAIILIPGFATVSSRNGTTTMTTPAVSFEKAQQVVDSYWFAPLVSPDFSPGVTLVRFPDGYRAMYEDALAIPSISHVIRK